MTLTEARARYAEIERELLNRNPLVWPGVSRSELIARKAGLAAEITRLKNERQAELESKSAAKRARKVERDEREQNVAARRAMFQPKPYEGPTCEFCGGPRPEQVCLNESVDWPHPPEAALS